MSKGRYHVRAMVTTDAEAVVRLARLFEPVSTTLWQGFDAEDVSTWLQERISLPQWAGFVAEIDGEIVGFAFCKDMKEDTSGFIFPHADETVYLLYLAVDEAFRGQGIAHALLGAVRIWHVSGGGRGSSSISPMTTRLSGCTNGSGSGAWARRSSCGRRSRRTCDGL